MTEAGLVLEGGATRGVFTSGALDYLMEKDRQVPVTQSIMSQSRLAGQGTV